MRKTSVARERDPARLDSPPRSARGTAPVVYEQLRELIVQGHLRGGRRRSPAARAPHHIKPQAERSERLSVSLLVSDLSTSTSEHEAIAATIERGNPDAAPRAVQTNRRNAAELLERAIDRAGELRRPTILSRVSAQCASPTGY